MTRNAKVALGLVGAAAAGAILGLLLAPEKGTDLRKRIRSKASDLKDQVNDYVAEGKEKLAEMKDRVMSDSNGMYKKHEEKYNF